MFGTSFVFKKYWSQNKALLCLQKMFTHKETASHYTSGYQEEDNRYTHGYRVRDWALKQPDCTYKMQGSTDWDHIRYCGQILQQHSKKKPPKKQKHIPDWWEDICTSAFIKLVQEQGTGFPDQLPSKDLTKIQACLQLYRMLKRTVYYSLISLILQHPDICDPGQVQWY